MKEKEILEQLNKFQQIKPDETWKKSNREILLSQISNSQVENVEFSWLQNLKFEFQALTSMSQPAMAVILICLFIVSGGTFGLKASQDTKPGDSLYIAKIVSEKAQLAFAFDERAKMKLGIEFAGNRMEELSQVLASNNDTSMSVEKKQVEANKLMDSFNKEMTIAKNRAEKIQPLVAAVDEEPVQADDAEGTVFTANFGKDSKGMQISDIQNNINIEKASSSEIVKESDPITILKQAKDYLAQDDFNAAISKLEEAGAAINGVASVADNNGEVKGIEATETSTPGENASTTDVLK